MRAQRGFTYLAVLFLVALTAAGLAALGQAWSTAAQRERERELAFRGQAIANAIVSYRQAAGPAAAWPRTLDDLLEDRRGVAVRHHLRQRYADPFTGQPDWLLVPADDNSGGFSGVRSRSDRPLLRVQTPGGLTLHQASDWLFAAPAAGVAASPPSSQPAP